MPVPPAAASNAPASCWLAGPSAGRSTASSTPALWTMVKLDGRAGGRVHASRSVQLLFAVLSCHHRPGCHLLVVGLDNFSFGEPPSPPSSPASAT
ncbi:MAG: hypothetical protein ACLRWQ_06935 [Flavonifractor plautii]